ncbi:MAG: hypothetical protein QM751_04065 [Paludibacteraceae bacterium]
MKFLSPKHHLKILEACEALRTKPTHQSKDNEKLGTSADRLHELFVENLNLQVQLKRNEKEYRQEASLLRKEYRKLQKRL